MRREAPKDRSNVIRVAVGALVAAALATLPTPALASHAGFVDKTGRGHIDLISVDSQERQLPGDSGVACDTVFGSQLDGASVSDNGRYVAFTSAAALSDEDTNQVLTDVYVRDRKKGTTTLASVTTVGLPAVPTTAQLEKPCLTWSFNPTLSGDGRYLVFTSYANLTSEAGEVGTPAADVLPFLKIYLRNLRTNRLELVSKAWNGQPSIGNSGMRGVSISKGGGTLAFISDATDLVEGQPTQCAPSTGLNRPCRQAYAWDAHTGRTQLVSVSTDEKLADNEVFGAEVSGDGRFVVFDSPASNLTKNDDNKCLRLATVYGTNCPDVFLRDLQKGKTEVISVGLSGRSANEASYRSAGSDGNVNRNFISSDGRYVLFNSSASDIVPAGESGTFVRDRKSGTTDRVSVNSNGAQTSGSFESMTEDGRYIMEYSSSCFYLACLTDTHTIEGTVVHDRITGQADIVKLNLKGTESINRTEDAHPATAISASGRYFVWSTSATDYIPSDTNDENFDVLFRDMGITRLGALPKSMKDYARISVPGNEGFAQTGILQLTAPDTSDPVGSRIRSGHLIYRPELNDLYLRIDVAHPGVAPLAAAPSLYGMRFTVKGVRYKVLAASSGVAPVTLFRCDESCAPVTTLEGSYGVVGQAVVARVPLGVLGLQDGGRIRDPEIFGTSGLLSGLTLTGL